MKHFTRILFLLLLAFTATAQQLPTLNDLPGRYQRRAEREADRLDRQIERDREAGFDITPFPGEVPIELPQEYWVDAQAILSWQTTTQRINDLAARLRTAWVHRVHANIVDSGVDGTHSELTKGYQGQTNYTSEGNIPGRHGTHVAGCVVQMVYPAIETGMFTYESHKTLLASGSGQIPWATAAYQGGRAKAKQRRAANITDVWVNSWGFSGEDAQLQAAMKGVYDEGSIICASAGNSGAAVLSPAKWPFIWAVSSLDPNLTISSFSSRGPEIDACAGGRDINSTLPGNTYGIMSGTSMSQPSFVGLYICVARGVYGFELLPDDAALRRHYAQVAIKVGNGDPTLYGPGYALIQAILDTPPTPGGGNPNPPPPPPPPAPPADYTTTVTVPGIHFMRWRREGETDWRILGVTDITVTVSGSDTPDQLHSIATKFVAGFFTNRGIVVTNEMFYTDATNWVGQFLKYAACSDRLNLVPVTLTGHDEFQRTHLATASAWARPCPGGAPTEYDQDVNTPRLVDAHNTLGFLTPASPIISSRIITHHDPNITLTPSRPLMKYRLLDDRN